MKKVIIFSLVMMGIGISTLFILSFFYNKPVDIEVEDNKMNTKFIDTLINSSKNEHRKRQ